MPACLSLFERGDGEQIDKAVHKASDGSSTPRRHTSQMSGIVNDLTSYSSLSTLVPAIRLDVAVSWLGTSDIHPPSGEPHQRERELYEVMSRHARQRRT